MKKYLKYKDDKSHKFWQIEVVDTTYTVTYGKVGTNGQSKTKEFESTEKALLDAGKTIKQKLKKGYQESNVNIEEVLEDTGDIDYFAELVKFDEAYGGETYAQSFWIVNDDDDYFESWLHDTDEEKVKEYAKSMKVFASADGTGARYAFWIKDKNTDYNNAPIICYGSEGDISLVAESIKDLIKMLSFGAEGMDGRFSHYIDDEDDEDFDFYEDFKEYFPSHMVFRSWMKEKLNIEPVNMDKLIQDDAEESDEINKLQKKARKKYKKDFDRWQYQFYVNPDEEDKKYQEEQNKTYETTKDKLFGQVAKVPTAKTYLKLAENENLLEEVNYEAREKYYKKALELEPENQEVLQKLAEENQCDNPKVSIKFYMKLISLSKTPEEYYGDIASVYEDSKQYIKAIEFYKKSILSGYDGWEGAYQEYIIDICERLKSKDGITILEETLEIKPNFQTYKVMYKYYLKKKKKKKALEHALNYIEHSDEQSHNFISLGKKLFKKELYTESLAVFEKVLNDKKDYYTNEIMAINAIGLCYLRIEPVNIDKAFEAFLQAHKLDEDEEAIWNNIKLCGNTFLANEEYDKALKIYDFYINTVDREDADIYNNIGVSYLNQNEYKKALMNFDKAVKLDADNTIYKNNIDIVKKLL